MGSHIEKSLEASDCSALERRGGGEKTEFLSIYLRINKVISEVTMEANLCWLRQSGSPAVHVLKVKCFRNARPESFQEIDRLK